jgi:vacuolar protein sorting-associated protein VTA1
VLSDVDPAKLADAEKHARYAISALQFEDVPTAIRELEHALAILRR